MDQKTGGSPRSISLEHNLGDPLADFQEAVQRSARSVWAYLQVARNHYLNHEFDRAVELCRLGLATATRDSDAALLFDLLALALYESHDSYVAIERAFQTAMSLDPFNPAIRHNFERFLAVSAQPAQPVGGGWVLTPLPMEEARRELYESVQPQFAQAA